MKDLFLKWHLGLGDSILCNGLARVLAKQCDRLVLPAKKNNFNSVKWQFSDLANVLVVSIEDESEITTKARMCEKSHALGMWTTRGMVNLDRWVEQFYADAGVSFECRWSEFYVPPCPQLVPPPRPYLFLHNEPGRYGLINRPLNPKLLVHKPSHPPNIFWHLNTLKNATEIHVINSCFMCLSEHVNTGNAKLFLHNYARSDCPHPTFTKQWSIIN